MFGNSMSFYGVLTYFTEFPNKGLFVSSLLASTCAMIYCVGFLRIIRCGQDLYSYKPYLGWLVSVLLVVSWTLFRSNRV